MFDRTRFLGTRSKFLPTNLKKEDRYTTLWRANENAGRLRRVLTIRRARAAGSKSLELDLLPLDRPKNIAENKRSIGQANRQR
jgi:hypothetical protein